MRTAELDSLAGRLRGLLAQGRYAEAQACLGEYGRVLEEAVRQLRPGDPGIGTLERAWRGLHADARRQVLIGRAHAALRLSRLPRPGLFSAAAPPRHTWDIFG